jgi:hypothetical protein
MTMGGGAVGEPNPFQGALWAEAKGMIAKHPQGLPDQQLLKLVDKATADSAVSPAEQSLLQVVADPANVQQISLVLKTRGSKGTFEAQGLAFDTVRGRQIRQNLHIGVAGQQIQNSYDSRAEARQPQIQQAAAKTRIGPGQPLTMATDAGRDAILDAYGQLAGSATYGFQACVTVCPSPIRN